MGKFIVEPHFRLQEWVAEEKGYFRAEGLDYEFRELIRSTSGQHHNKGAQGAFQSIEKGREADVSCACFQSGSHYSTIQALEQYLKRDEINLNFEDGMLFRRLELLIEGKSRAAALFSGPYYLVEQLGFRKVIDTTFMIAAMINGAPAPEDVRRYFGALKRAQRDIDLRPELYTRYYKNEFPERYHAMMDTRRWGPGERIVFETYSKEVFEQSFNWIAQHEIFAEGRMGSGDYDKAAVSFAVR